METIPTQHQLQPIAVVKTKIADNVFIQAEHYRALAFHYFLRIMADISQVCFFMYG